MFFALLAQVILNGLVSGLIYALTAAGFSLIYGNANILFFTIGEVYMLGAILFYFLVVQVGISYFFALALVLVAMGSIGVILERTLFRYLKGNDLTFAFATLALGMLIAGIALETFGERGKGVTSPFSGKLTFLGLMITWDKVVVVVMAIAILIGLHFFFTQTKGGRAIRAVSQDAEAAKLMGIDVNKTNALTFFLGLSLAGLAGALVTPLYYADVFMGAPVLMVTLIVVVLGGLGSFPGAIMGGVFIGLLESFGYTFLGGITTLISFLAVIVLLIFRPQGLLGRK